MNYTNLLYHQIVKRITRFQARNHYSGSYMADSIGMSAGDYSNLIHIRTDVPNKRYLLSATHLGMLVDTMETSFENLVWGDEQERETFVKLIFIEALVNGSRTAPIQYYSDTLTLFQWALTQESLPSKVRGYVVTAVSVLESIPETNPEMDPESVQVYPAYTNIDNSTPPPRKPMPIKKVRAALSRFFHREYGFFYDEKNASMLLLLRDKHDRQLEPLSNEILNQMLGYYPFAVHYTPRLLTDYENKASGSFEERKAALSKLITGSNNGDIILDWAGKDYCYFVYAFNRFWDTHKREIMAYFQKKFFSDKSVLDKGLKVFPNKVFNNLVSSSELLNIIRTRGIMDEYVSDETFIALNYYRFAVQSAIKKQRILCNEEERNPDATELRLAEMLEPISKELTDKLMNLLKEYGPLLQNQKR